MTVVTQPFDTLENTGENTWQVQNISSDLLRAMADHMPQLCWMARADGWITWYNKRWFDYTGKTPEELAGWGWQTVHDPNRLPEVMMRWNNALARGEAFEMVFPLRGADGKFRDFLTRITPHRDDTGKIQCWFGVNTDVSELIRAKDDLRISEGRLRAFADSDLVGILFGDIHGNIEHANNEFLRIIGRTRTELERGEIRWDTITPPEWLELDALRIAEAQTRGACTHYEKEYIRPDGSRVPVLVGYVLIPPEREKSVAFILDISERRHHEIEREKLLRRLEEEQARLQAILDHVPVGVVFAEAPTGKITMGNPYVEKLVRHPVLHSTDVSDYGRWVSYHEDGRRVQSADYPLARVFKTGEPALGEYHYQRGDGTLAWLRLVAAPIRDRQEKLLGAVVAMIDIDKEKRAEQRILESERRFRAITEAMPQIVWSTQPDGYHDYFNQRWYDYTGVASGDTHGQRWNTIVHPDDQERAWAIWKNSLTTGEPYEIEYRLRRFDNVYRWFLARALPVLDDSGRIERWFGTCTDIDDAIRARETLAHNQEILEKLVAEKTAERDRVWRLSKDLLVVAGVDGYFKSVNPSWYRILGYTDDRWEREPFLEFVHPDDRRSTLAELATLADGKTTLNFENRYRHADGSYRWLSWTAVLEEGLMYCVARDITDQKLAEEALLTTQQALAQSQKMEAIGQLTGGLAHDFNNLLTVIVGNLELARNRVKGDARFERNISQIAAAAERGRKLTQQLLAFSRKQKLETQVANLNQIIANLHDMVSKTLGQNIVFETRLAPNLPNMTIDPTQLELAVINVLVNARDAMPEGGTVIIETRDVILGPQELPIHQASLLPGRYVMLSITDEGMGMPPDILARITEPFFTTKEAGKGTGLGLSQVYGFVRQSSGSLQVSSEVGVGTVVTMLFPASDDALPHPANQTLVPLGEDPCTSEVILVVEDNVEVLEMACTILREEGYQVVTADNASRALEVLEATPNITVLFSDVVMPGGMNGVMLAEEAKRRQPSLKLLLTTGFAEDFMKRETNTQLPVLQKPYRPSELSERIRRLIQDG